MFVVDYEEHNKGRRRRGPLKNVIDPFSKTRRVEIDDTPRFMLAQQHAPAVCADLCYRILGFPAVAATLLKRRLKPIQIKTYDSDAVILTDKLHRFLFAILHLSVNDCL